MAEIERRKRTDGRQAFENIPAQLGPLILDLDIEMVQGDTQEAIIDTKYKLVFENGSEIEGSTDSNGRILVRNTPPGKVKLSILDFEENNVGQALSDTYPSSGKEGLA